jgi:transposase
LFQLSIISGVAMGDEREKLSKLYTKKAFAKHLGISESTVNTWMNKGKLVEERHYVRKSRWLRFFLNDEIIRELHEPRKKQEGVKEVKNTKKEKKLI